MKGLILYYKTSGITCLKNHVDVDHSIIFKNIEEVNSLVKGNLEKQCTKKRTNVSSFSISIFFASKDLFKKDVVE
jgi:hypothetical protein